IHANVVVDLWVTYSVQIHLNLLHETDMHEGSRQFSSWLGLLEDIVAGVEVPVIVKEVGFGLSAKTVEHLYNIGVRIVDVAGSGGAIVARVEHARTPHSPA